MKRLYRSRKDKVISGLCGGIGEYFNVDPVIIRVLAVFLTFWGGSGVLAYIVGVIVVPLQPLEAEESEAPVAAEQKAPVINEKPDLPVGRSAETGALIIGIVLVVLGGIFLLRNVPLFDDYYWWFRHHIGRLLWPSILIAVGAFMIIRGAKK